MAIKKIQLRGISRTPSDRLTADGGCAESLNVFLDEDELAPMPVPEDVTSQLGLPTNQNAEAVYIHKTEDYTNFIFKKKVSGTDRIGIFSGSTFTAFYSLSSNETLKEITSIGNTLLILTTKHMEFVLYKNGAYTDLGDHIPMPKMNVRAVRSNSDLLYNDFHHNFFVDYSSGI